MTIKKWINSKVRTEILLIILPYIWAILFFFLPFLLLIIISFSEVKDSVPPYQNIKFQNINWEYFRLIFSNYNFILGEKLYFSAYIQSLKIAFFSTILAFSIGYPLGYGMSKAYANLRPVLLILIIIPFFTSSLVRVYCWMTILKTYGVLNDFLLYIGLINKPLKFLNSYGAVIIGITYSYLPFMVLPIYFSLEKINPRIIEAAADLGAEPLTVFWKIIFPLSIDGIITGFLMVFIPSIGEFVIPDILGGTRVITIGKVVWNEFFLNRDWPTSSALSLIMIIIVIIPMIIIQKNMDNKNG